MIKNCKWCGKEFDALTNRARFDSDECERYYRRYNKPKVCPICNKTFLTKKGYTKVCSDECIKQAIYENGKIQGVKARGRYKKDEEPHSLCGFCKSEIPLGEKYCSAECRQNNIDRKKHKKPHIKTDLDGFCKGIPVGMSYGQYVASLNK